MPPIHYTTLGTIYLYLDSSHDFISFYTPTLAGFTAIPIGPWNIHRQLNETLVKLWLPEIHFRILQCFVCFGSLFLKRLTKAAEKLNSAIILLTHPNDWRHWRRLNKTKHKIISKIELV